MPGTFSLIAGGCLLASAPNLPDSSKFRAELMSWGRCCLCGSVFVEFSEVILFSSNMIMFAQGIYVPICARVCDCVCVHICLL